MGAVGTPIFNVGIMQTLFVPRLGNKAGAFTDKLKVDGRDTSVALFCDDEFGVGAFAFFSV